MKVMDLFRAQFDANRGDFEKRLAREYTPKYLKDIKLGARYFFGAAWWNNKKTYLSENGVLYICPDDVEDLFELKSNGFVNFEDHLDWKSRQLGRTCQIYLTAKGLKMFHEMYFKVKKEAK